MRGLRKMITKTPLFIRVVSLYVIAGLMLFTSSQLLQLGNNTIYTTRPLPQKAVIDKPIVISKQVIDGEPSSMQIERIGMNLMVRSGIYDQKTGWTLSDDAVHYAQMTALPNNQQGNTFFYGHNTRRVLGPMSAIIVGDVVTVNTVNGHVFKYVYVNDALVPPDLTSVLYDNPDMPRLTIMTCDGVWSQARRLMYFNLQEAK